MGNVKRKVLSRKEYLKEIKKDIHQLEQLMEGNFEGGLVLNGIPLKKVAFQDENAQAEWNRLMMMFSSDVVELLYKYEHLFIARRNDAEYGMTGANKELYMEKLPKLAAADATWIQKQVIELIGINQEQYGMIVFECGIEFLEAVEEDDSLRKDETFWKWFKKKIYEYNCWFRGLPHTAGSATERYYKQELRRYLKLRKIWKSFEYHRENIF